jgi:hypothetical protein
VAFLLPPVAALYKRMVSVLATEGAEAVPLMSRLVPPTSALLEKYTCVPLTHTPRSAGYVTNTSLVPRLKLTNEPELLEASTVSRERVVPDAVYVPIPTSHSVTVWLAIQ